MFSSFDVYISTRHTMATIRNAIMSLCQVILSSSAIEASHNWLIRQFELYAIIAATYTTHVCCCIHILGVVGCDCSLQFLCTPAQRKLSMARSANSGCMKMQVHFQINVFPHLRACSQMTAWSCRSARLMSLV